MTQSSLQTRCPKCETRFRVTDAQLSVASGKVRCGNCMAVFNAVEHRISEGSSGASSPKSGPAALEQQDAPAHQGFASDDDLIFADNPEEDAAEGPYAGTRLTFSDDELSDSFRTVDERSGGTFETDNDDETDEKIDESWAEAMLSEEDDTRRKAKPAPTEPEPPEEPAEFEQPQPEPPENEPFEEPAWDEPEETPRQPEDLSLEPVDNADGFYVDEPQSSSFDYDAGPVTDNEPLVAVSPYSNLRREPVSVAGNGRGRVRAALWTLIILALLGVLVAQVTWFQFDRLSSIPELRPFYEQGCEIAGCELKPLINVDAIQSRKLVVRTNPENRSQLVVDAVIINRAAFEQPFPAIALTFSNLNGDVVAQSVFTPDEYLAGDGRDLEAMPTDTPVRIVINIRDPGKDAVNYNIAFRAYQE
ncbi:MJ0042 family finger-like domain-containing protein [Marinobacter salarius]|uniref:MJ0042 family finger-like domain-containing protein n=2 Tax=Marinobacter TaxID=2742 RepID=A0ABY1FPU7_9GAMM|nr:MULTISPECIES: DUF3426 domain-containing protein [Marinobacter]EDM47313.1 hypothetical protein MDG893_04664 [Marinobacter algicola DG893]KXJ45583.1 MAG: hypothetical protein AXW11_12530 [Marinobacter sp. Hex_13]SFL78413.1 MJ0042 family finger-like domain-containing protein [Marinobacter salarius]